MAEKTRVFLSYAREDERLAECIGKSLCDHGYDVWWDKASLVPGELWENSIRREIARADFFVTIQSPNSVNKPGNFQKEQRWAIEKQHTFPPRESFIIPLRVDYCEIAFAEIRSVQWIEVNGDLKSALASLIDRLGGDKSNLAKRKPKKTGSEKTLVNNIIAAPDSKNKYVLHDLWYQTGMYCYFRGRCIEGDSQGREVVMMLPQRAEDNDLIERHVEMSGIARHIDPHDIEQAIFLKRIMIPKVLEVVHFVDDSNSNVSGKIACLMRHTDAIKNLLEIKRQFSDGLDSIFLCWMIERMLLMLGLIHDQDIILGCINPSSIWILDRDPRETAHCRAIFANYSGAFNLDVGETYRLKDAYSAPEVGHIPNPHESSDIYSLGLCFMFLMGGNNLQPWMNPKYDEKIRCFVTRLMEKSRERRPKKVWPLFEEFQLIRKAVHGEPGLIFMESTGG